MRQLTVSNPRTLIADDQPDVLIALSLLLKSAGHQTETVTSPAAAVAALRRRDFDVVLMDLNYARDTTSGQEGLDLLTRIQAIDKTLPVVVMTAWATVDLAIEAMHRGVRDFVQKPWDNRRLLQTVETQIRNRRARQRRHLLNARRRSLSKGLRQELAEAADIQRVLLPRRMPQLEGIQISAEWRPANSVSGDYFDILEFSEDQIGLCIADVAGKGLPAALLMANLQATLKSCSSATVPPGKLCRRINQIICDNTSDRQFITFFYGLLDKRQRTFTYSNAGHNPPLLIRRNGAALCLGEGGGVLGVLPEQDYAEKTITLATGDRLVFFTDGFTEARDVTGEEFGELRLRDLLINQRSSSAVELAAKAMQSVTAFCGGKFSDDVTLMMIAVE
jgi:sigma-B regulation protein RsbU (phosphoserine phosphatase)